MNTAVRHKSAKSTSMSLWLISLLAATGYCTRIAKVKNPVAELRFDVVFADLPPEQRSILALNANPRLRASLSDALAHEIVHQEFIDVQRSSPLGHIGDHIGEVDPTGSSFVQSGSGPNSWDAKLRILIADTNQHADPVITASQTLTASAINQALESHGLLRAGGAGGKAAVNKFYVQSVSFDANHDSHSLDNGHPTHIMVEVPPAALMERSRPASEDIDVATYADAVDAGQFQTTLDARLGNIEDGILKLAQRLRENTLGCTAKVKYFAGTILISVSWISVFFSSTRVKLSMCRVNFPTLLSKNS